jgi:hypothetical protein
LRNVEAREESRIPVDTFLFAGHNYSIDVDVVDLSVCLHLLLHRHFHRQIGAYWIHEVQKHFLCWQLGKIEIISDARASGMSIV